jgi:lipopolysaccharide transport system permease protein
MYGQPIAVEGSVFMGMINDTWRFRQFILSSVQSELATRFVRSRLGGLWMVIHPLGLVLMYTLILSAVLSAKLPGMEQTRFAYAIYLLSGILGWSMFAEVVERCSRVFIDNAEMMKKMVFPRICLPLIVVGSALLNNFFLFAAGFLVFIVLGHIPGWNLAWLPVVMAVNLGIAAGIGLILGVFNVFVRDVGQMVSLALQYGFWFTPIVYMPGILPEKLRALLQLNPLYWVVTGYQNILVFHAAPHLSGLALVAAFAGLLLVLALYLFRRAAPEMVDVL